MKSPGEALLETQVKTLILPIALLSKNGRDALHWSQRRKLRQTYALMLRTKHPRKEPPVNQKQRVTFTRILGKGEKLFDDSNVAGGSCVELQDAMTACGFWVDDSPKFLESCFAQIASQRKLGPAVLIEIEVLS